MKIKYPTDAQVGYYYMLCSKLAVDVKRSLTSAEMSREIKALQKELQSA